MKRIIPFIALMLLVAGCSTKKELSYLNNLDLPETGGRDFLYHGYSRLQGPAP